MTITYQLGNALYINITNRCPCDCIFCLRKETDTVGNAENLWLEHEPDINEIINDLNKRSLTDYSEIVFCGFGEPTENLDALLAAAEYIKKSAPNILVRLNTNGLSDLINKKETAPLLKGLIDIVSISLNAPNAKRYGELSHPAFDAETAFGNLLKFAEGCKNNVSNVVFTIVDILDEKEKSECFVLAENMGIPLRVRTVIK